MECLGGAGDGGGGGDRVVHDAGGLDFQRVRREFEERVVGDPAEFADGEVDAAGDHGGGGAGESRSRDGEQKPARAEDPIRVPGDCGAVAQGFGVREGGSGHRAGKKAHLRRQKIRRRAVFFTEGSEFGGGGRRVHSGVCPRREDVEIGAADCERHGFEGGSHREIAVQSPVWISWHIRGLRRPPKSSLIDRLILIN